MTQGRAIPRPYDLFPGNTGANYLIMRRQARGEAGESASSIQRVAEIGFDRASIDDAQGRFPVARIAACYYHIGQSAYRNVQRLGPHRNYAEHDGSRLCTRAPIAIAFLPWGHFSGRFVLLVVEFFG